MYGDNDPLAETMLSPVSEEDGRPCICASHGKYQVDDSCLNSWRAVGRYLVIMSSNAYTRQDIITILAVFRPWCPPCSIFILFRRCEDVL